MRRFLIGFAVFITSVFLLACDRHIIEGNGNLVTQAREVMDFSELNVSGDFTVNIEYSSKPELEVKADKNIQPYIVTTVEQGRLMIGVKPPYQLKPSQPIQLTIKLPQLDVVELNGKIAFSAKKLKGDHLRFQSHGEDLASLSGKVDQVAYLLDGRSELNAANLMADNVNIKITGRAKASVQVDKKLEVFIKGEGRVTYFGQPPIINQEIYDGGQLVKGR